MATPQSNNEIKEDRIKNGKTEKLQVDETVGWLAAIIVRTGLIAPAISAPVNPATSGPARPIPSQRPNQKTMHIATKASVWNVFSRHRATIAPSDPAVMEVISVTAKVHPTCSNEVPPKRTINIKIGKLVISITPMLSRLANSLPRTSSLLVNRLIKSKIRVCRSFSIAMLLAA